MNSRTQPPASTRYAQALAALDEVVELDPEIIAHYRTHGHVTVRGAIPPIAVEMVLPDAIEAVKREQLRPLDGMSEEYSRAYSQGVNLGAKEPDIAAITRCRRIASMVAQLIDSAGVRLFIEDTMVKRAGDLETHWHQDECHLAMTNVRMATAWIIGQPLTPQSGGLRFAQGSQVLGVCGPAEIGPGTREVFEKIVEEEGYPIAYIDDLQPGDVSFHDGRVIHSAGANETDQDRYAFAVHCYNDGALVDTPRTDSAASMLRQFGGGEIGEPAQSDAWVLLYDGSAE